MSKNIAPADERAAFESLKGAWQSMPPFDVFCAGWQAARASSANETGAEGAEPMAIPAGWKLVRVNEHFDALIAALERAESKGYLPDSVREEWENFACDENVTQPAAAPKFNKQKMLASAREHGMDLGDNPVAYEFYNKATGHAVVDYTRWTHRGHLTEKDGYEARPLAYANAEMAQPAAAPIADAACKLPTMRKAFRVTEVSGDPDPAKQSFAMRFSFPSIEALHAADDEWNKFTASAPSPADERAACQAAPADPRDITADTGHPEADWIIRRLTSDDPDFSDCAYAAWLIRKLARAQHEAAQAHKRCVGWAILNGVCVVDFSRDGAQARSMAREMQRSHDLSGSLAAFHVEPVFIVTGGADAAQPAPGAFEVTEEVAAAWALRHDVEHALKHYSAQRNAIEDARTLHLITQ